MKHYLDDANGVTEVQRKRVFFSLERGEKKNTREVIFSPNSSFLRAFIDQGKK